MTSSSKKCCKNTYKYLIKILLTIVIMIVSHGLVLTDSFPVQLRIIATD